METTEGSSETTRGRLACRKGEVSERLDNEEKERDRLRPKTRNRNREWDHSRYN